MKSGIFSLVQFVLKLFYSVTKSFYVNHQRKTLEKLVGKVGQSLNNFGITFTTTSAGCSLRNCEAKLAKTYLRILFQPSKQDLKKILPLIKYNFRQNLKNILYIFGGCQNGGCDGGQSGEARQTRHPPHLTSHLRVPAFSPHCLTLTTLGPFQALAVFKAAKLIYAIIFA